MQTESKEISINGFSGEGVYLNVHRMNRGQQELFKYLLDCYKKDVPCEMKQIAIIYYTYNRRACKMYERKSQQWVRCTPEEYVEDTIKYSIENNYVPFAYSERAWLKSNIGSFVMRGLLTVIPKFNPKEIQE